MLVLFLMIAMMTAARAHDWSSPVLLADRMVSYRSGSVDSNYDAGFLYMKAYEKSGNMAYAQSAREAMVRATALSQTGIKPAMALLQVDAIMGENPPIALVEKILEKLKSGPLKVGELIALRQLVNCQISGYCRNDVAMILDHFFRALLENPDNNGIMREDISYFYAVLLSTMKNRTGESINILQELAERNPDRLEFRVKLIEILLNNGQFDKAAAWMEKTSSKQGLQWNLVERKE